MAKNVNSCPSSSMEELDEGQTNAILAIVQKANAEHDLSSLLALLSQEATELLQAERASVFLLDKEACELWSIVALPNESIRFDARLGLAGASAMTGQSIRIADAQKDPRFHTGIDVQTKFRTRSVLVVPLRKNSGEIIGTFQFLNKKAGQFSKNDQLLGEALAKQVVLAIDTAELVGTLKQKHHKLELENLELRKEVAERSGTQEIIGISSRMQDIVRAIDQISHCSFDVLITGENGTGKELVAKAIHSSSPRALQPFVELNCAALPENLVESELFGIEKGVATGVDARKGKFEQAQGGTLFLDEIGELALPAQAKILRILQERRLAAVGTQESRPIDVRVVAATNKNLDAAIEKGSFRQDLFYRLKVIHLKTPALRDIPEDIPMLANFFLLRSSKEVGSEPKRFSAKALSLLRSYSWPGNVRQLENEIKRLAVMVRGDIIAPEDLDESLQRQEQEKGPLIKAREPQTLKESMDQIEKQLLEQALQNSRYHQGETAKALGLSRQGLIKKLKRFGIAGSP